MDKRLDIYDFLRGNSRNTWLDDGKTKVYVRNSHRRFTRDGGFLETLDISSVEVNADNRGKGIFREWLEHAEIEAKQSGKAAIYVENVLTEQFANFFRRRGYAEIDYGCDGPPCFYVLCDDL